MGDIYFYIYVICYLPHSYSLWGDLARWLIDLAILRNNGLRAAGPQYFPKTFPHWYIRIDLALSVVELQVLRIFVPGCLAASTAFEIRVSTLLAGCARSQRPAQPHDAPRM